jgi:hypothetical protein
MGIIDSTKELAKLAQQIGNIEVYNQVIALQSQVMELMSDNMKARDELRASQDEIRTLRDNAELAKSLNHDGERYWLTKDGRKDGPFCSTCWDIDSKLVRMKTYQAYETRETSYVCDYCGRHRSRGYAKSSSGD